MFFAQFEFPSAMRNLCRRRTRDSIMMMTLFALFLHEFIVSDQFNGLIFRCVFCQFLYLLMRCDA